MINDLDSFEDLLLGDDGLLTSLRLGYGLKQDKVEKLCDILKKLAEEWREERSVPKKAVDIFIDFYPTIESVCNLYSENEAIIIMDAGDKIMDLIRECVIN
ncbi:hypothetical protein DV092_07855 [Clostridium botulinum]|uniref:hypothetical protein n=1 Tax=Clostridium sp. VAP51 TaxID=2949978 RepID=UPI00207A76A6|nr:hypothetical protein [Clostridium sp. VAP51]MBN1051974.1 hypothetical protein [Clostridium botulinum]